MKTQACMWLSPEDRATLEGWVADRNTQQKLVWRSRIVLMSAAGAGNGHVRNVRGSRCRRRFRWCVDAAQVCEMKAQGLGATAIAKELGIGRASVYRALEGDSI
jgi:hypothetical protein